MLHINNVSKSFHSSNNQGKKSNVLSNLNFRLEASQFHSVIGPNASGKSTLLKLASGIISPDQGEIKYEIEGKNKPRFGVVWQNYRESNFPWLTVSENIAFPLKFVPLTEHETEDRVSGILEKYVPEIDPHKKMYELSGGQQQIIAILRNIVNEPDIFFADEPFSALDQTKNWEMICVMEQIWSQNPIPVLWVSHDIDEAILLSDAISCLSAKTKKIEKTIRNSMTRPRTIEMIYSEEHLSIKKELIDFLLNEQLERFCDE